MTKIDRLPHDAYLQDIQVDWGTGLAKLRFGFEGSEIALTATGLTKLALPRAQPWGRSIWVNEADGPRRLSDGLETVLIQMQSGDRIEIVAAEIRLEAAPRSGDAGPSNAGEQ